MNTWSWKSKGAVKSKKLCGGIRPSAMLLLHVHYTVASCIKKHRITNECVSWHTTTCTFKLLQQIDKRTEQNYFSVFPDIFDSEKLLNAPELNWLSWDSECLCSFCKLIYHVIISETCGQHKFNLGIPGPPLGPQLWYCKGCFLWGFGGTQWWVVIFSSCAGLLLPPTWTRPAAAPTLSLT